jgi:hypothetical protein
MFLLIQNHKPLWKTSVCHPWKFTGLTKVILNEEIAVDLQPETMWITSVWYLWQFTWLSK